MKTLLSILLPISLLLNGYFLHKIYEEYHFKQIGTESIFTIKDISLTQGTNYLINRLKQEHPNLVTKKYYFINIWNINCAPCIKEIPTLDSLALNIKRSDIGFIFLTENGSSLIANFLNKRNIATRNFIFVNDANDYISAILKEKRIKNKGYPIQLIINKSGDIKFFYKGVINNSNDTTLINCINHLK